MDKNKILKIIFLIFIGLFASFLIALKTGYYNVKSTKDKVLTEEEIVKFEEDVKNGKDIDVTSYTKENYKTYNTNLSDDIYNISLKLEFVFDKAIKNIFSGASKLVSD